jgi:hypothetical protein
VGRVKKQGFLGKMNVRCMRGAATTVHSKPARPAAVATAPRRPSSTGFTHQQIFFSTSCQRAASSWMDGVS